jgi:hypothetical protein
LPAIRPRRENTGTQLDSRAVARLEQANEAAARKIVPDEERVDRRNALTAPVLVPLTIEDALLSEGLDILEQTLREVIPT